MTMSALESASRFCGFASYECGSALGSLMIDVMVTASPPMRAAMSPYTLLEATIAMPSSPDAGEPEPHPEASITIAARPGPSKLRAGRMSVLHLIVENEFQFRQHANTA